jgi:hypothetical protein
MATNLAILGGILFLMFIGTFIYGAVELKEEHAT